MKLLLDAHVLIWALYYDQQLSPKVADLLEDEQNDLYISDATMWEILAKIGRGQLRLTEDTVTQAAARIDALGVLYLPIDRIDVLASTQLPHHHSNPFDRLLIAISTRTGFPLVTHDGKLSQYGTDVIW